MNQPVHLGAISVGSVVGYGWPVTDETKDNPDTLGVAVLTFTQHGEVAVGDLFMPLAAAEEMVEVLQKLLNETPGYTRPPEGERIDWEKFEQFKAPEKKSNIITLPTIVRP